jgi:FtsP/CotA-like multicopper oxidase with cupredoxin domain
LLIFIFFLGTTSTSAQVLFQCPSDTDGVDTDGDGNVTNDHVCMHLTAGDGFINLADDAKTLQYIFSFTDVTGISDDQVIGAGILAAEFAAPTIDVKEGQKLYLTLTNVGLQMRPDLDDPHTVHFHGFPHAASIFDGLPESAVSIRAGASFTYFYDLVEPGTFIYHCHVEAPEHMQMAMLGNLFVRPKQDNLPDGTVLNGGFVHHTGYKYVYNDGDGSTYYDVGYPIQFHSFDPVFHDAQINIQPASFANMRDTYSMFNGRGYPDTVNPNPLPNTFDGKLSQKVSSLITATKGQKILIRFSSLSTVDYFTVTALGIPMKIVGHGARLLRGPDGKNLFYDTTSVTIGGGESADVILDTTNVPAGTYFLYTTNLNKLSNGDEDFGGIMTEIRINP